MNRSYFFSIIIAVFAILLVAPFSGAADKAKIIAKDGQYVSYENGIVYDEKTKLEWFVGPDRDTDWNQAKSWVENLTVDGGGWRMPTREELNTLYQIRAGSRKMTSLLKTTGWYIWSGETKDSSSAWYFDFKEGYEPRSPRTFFINMRGFAVRSR